MLTYPTSSHLSWRYDAAVELLRVDTSHVQVKEALEGLLESVYVEMQLNAAQILILHFPNHPSAIEKLEYFVNSYDGEYMKQSLKEVASTTLRLLSVL